MENIIYLKFDLENMNKSQKDLNSRPHAVHKPDRYTFTTEL